MARGFVGISAATAGFALLGKAASAAAVGYAEAERSQVRFQAVLKATGNSAGITVSGLSAFADQMEKTRIVTAEAVTDAASILATFKSVSGDTFTRAISLAQDLSSVFGSDLSSAATQLGKALEDPVAGIGALTRVGITFSDAQKGVIASLVETGRTAEAQRIILDTLAGQVGGAGEAEGNTLSGAFARASAAAGNFLEKLFEISGQAESTRNALEVIASGLDSVFAESSEQDERLAAFKELQDLQRQIQEARAGPLAQNVVVVEEIAELEKRAAAARQRVDELGQSIEKVQQTDLNSLRQQAERGSLAPRPAGPNPQLLYPARTLEDEKTQADLRNQIARDAESAAAKRASSDQNAADKARSLANARADLIGRMKQEVSQQELLSEATSKGASALELARIENEKQAAILEASKTLKGEDLAYYASLAEQAAASKRSLVELADAKERAARQAEIGPAILATERSNRQALGPPSLDQRIANTERGNRQALGAGEMPAEQVQAEYDRYLEDMNVQTQRAADIQSEILIEPWKELAAGVSSIMGGVFEDILTDMNSLDFGSILDGLQQTGVKAVSGALGNLVTAPLNQAVSAIASGQYSSPLDFAQQRPVMAAGALGFVGGQIGTQLLGMEGKYGGLGGSVGAMAGTALGGPLGGLAGGVIGSLAGGMFGAENNLGNDRSAQTFNTRRGITYSDTSFSPENRSITSGLATELDTLIDVFGDLGGTVGQFNLRLEAGNKSGITVNGKKYATAQDALRASLEEVIGQTTGLSATQQTVLSATKGGTAAEIGADLAFGETYDRLIDQGRDVDQALKDLNGTFQSAARDASRLGLDVEALAQAHQREAQAIVDEYQARQRATSINIESLARGAGPNIDIQFAELELQMQGLAKEAIELGIGLDRVTAAHQAQANVLAFQYAQQQRSVAEQIAQARGDTSLPTQLHILETQMRALAQAAAAAGIPVEQVAAAHQAQAQALVVQRQQQQRNLVGQIAQAGGDDSLATQLYILETSMRDLAKAAADLDLPLSLVTRAHQLAADRIIDAQRELQEETKRQIREQELAIRQQERNIQGQVRGVENLFKGLIDPLKAVLANDNRLSPLGQITQARQQFRTLADQAQGGDLEAIQQLAGAASNLQSLAGKFLGSGGQGAEIAREIDRVLTSQVGALQQQQVDVMATLPDVMRETTASVVAVLQEQIGLLIEEQKRSRYEITKLQRNVA